MWIKKQVYEDLCDRLDFLTVFDESNTRRNQMLLEHIEMLKNEIKIRNDLENRRKSEARMKERKESHEYAKLCLEKAKYELECGNAENAKLLFSEYEQNIDYRVEENNDLVK